MNNKKKINHAEKILLLVIAVMAIGTPLISITIKQFEFGYAQKITQIDQELEQLRQESGELSVKRDEKLTFSQISEYAARDGLTNNQGNVRNIA
jgi:Protein required for the initiation of cell division